MNLKKEIILDSIKLLQNNFKKNISKSYEWRRDTLLNFKRLVTDYQQKMEEAKFKDMKMNHYQTLVLETSVLVMMINHSLSHLNDWIKVEKCDTPLPMYPGKVYRKYEPLGVTLIIGSWNYPFFTTFLPLISAISAGNPCVIKPSEGTPECSSLMKEIIDQMDQDYFACFEGDKEVGVFLNQQNFAHIIFTGGSKTAQYILKDAAPTLAKVTLELGGQNHTVIDLSANLDRAAKSIGTFKFANCGQTCITTNHLFIHKSQTQDFIKKLKLIMQEYYGKDSYDNKAYGRINNTFLAKQFGEKIKEVQNQVIYQQGDINVEDRFVPPTLVLNPSWDSKLMQEEIFGPILPIFEYDDISEVIKKINEFPRGLTMSYFGDLNTSLYQRLLNETDSGSLLSNEQGMCACSYTTGFGGVGYSGQGKIDGFDGFKTCSYDRVVIERPKNLLKALDVEDRYREVNNSSRKTWMFIISNIGHRTIEDITRTLKKLIYSGLRLLY